MELKDVATIVSGGASGLGAETARRLARNGARVTIFDGDEQGAAVAHAIGGAFIMTDITDDAEVSRAIGEAERRHGIARVLVNASTTAASEPLIDDRGAPYPLEAFRRTLELNLTSTFNVLSKFAARLSTAEVVGEERGVIVNTASAAYSDGQIGHSAYTAAKAGVAGMTLPLARELAALRIRVMAISPGVFATPGFLQLPAALRESVEAQVPHPSRAGAPDEYARLVLQIVENAMLNGDIIRLDGGVRLPPR